MIKTLLILLLIVTVFVSGCINQKGEKTKYVCPDGTIVDAPNLCPIATTTAITTTSTTEESTTTITSTTTSTSTTTTIMSTTTTTTVPITTSTTVVTSTTTTTTTTILGSWHEVTSFSGTTDKTTDTFYISGEKWRFTWGCTSTVSEEHQMIGIFAYPEGETAIYVASVTFAKCSEGDTTYVYEGPGSYYFVVGAANLESWSITVESYH